MKKNIKKYSASLIVIVLSIMLGYAVYAEDNTTSPTVRVKSVLCTMEAKLCPDGVTYVGRTLPNCEFAKCPGSTDSDNRGEVKQKLDDIRNRIKTNIEDNQNKREDFRAEVKSETTAVRALREENKIKLEAMLQSVKEKREAFKIEIDAKRVEVMARVTEMRAKFQESLKNVKDENKKISAEKIVDTIASLNTRLTNEFSNKVDQIENVLVSIESRIVKAENRGLDVATVKLEVVKAKTAIAQARTAISAQVAKVYGVNVTSEVTLRAEMKKLRDTFSTDMKIVHEKIKLAHVAVRNTATTLAKIPNIDVEVEIEVEVNNTTN